MVQESLSGQGPPSPSRQPCDVPDRKAREPLDVGRASQPAPEASAPLQGRPLTVPQAPRLHARVHLESVGKSYPISPDNTASSLFARLVGDRRTTHIVALADIHLDLYPDEFVCLIGPSGSGKTTLLNVIAGLVPPTTGTVTLDGVPVTKPGPDRAVVFQSPAILPWMTVVGNIALAPRYAGRTVTEQRRIVAELVELFELADFQHCYPHELSGGLQSRVALACAYAADPAILLMDEPFGSLDILSRERLQDELLRLWRITPRTTLFVTHDIEEALYLGDRLVILGGRPGRIMGDFAVPFPRPRDQFLKASVEFQRLRRDIKAFVRKLEMGDVPQALPSVEQVSAGQLDFASSISHELRTPLTSIKALSELLAYGNFTDETARELAVDILGESQRIERTVADLLDVSRLDTGRMTLAKDRVSVAQLVNDAVRTFDLTASGRRIVAFVQPGLPDVHVDVLRVQQVIHNLLLNAIAYSPSDQPVEVSARSCQDGQALPTLVDCQDCDWPVIEVLDRGIGIPEHELHRVFDKFYRAANAESQRPRGTGLGLFLARRIIELHGGDIWARHRLGGGTVIGFSLPLGGVSI